MDAIPEPLVEPVSPVRLRRLSLLAATSIIALAVTVLAALVYNQHRRDDELAAQARLICRYTTFTRVTQRGVVRYIHDQNEVESRAEENPKLLAFYRSQVHVLDALYRRTDPPACQQ